MILKKTTFDFTFSTPLPRVNFVKQFLPTVFETNFDQRLNESYVFQCSLLKKLPFLLVFLAIQLTAIAETTLLQAYLKASNTAAPDKFGSSVAISGDTAVVGAPDEWSQANGQRVFPHLVDSGAAYVFVKIGEQWVQQAYLKASNPDISDHFGASVDIFGDTIIVGATGEDSSSIGVNSISNELSNGAGAAYVFVRNGTNWTQQAYLKAHHSVPMNRFGIDTAIFGDKCIVGSSGAKEAYVFVRNGTTWSPDVYFFDETRGFGSAVDISEERAIVGSLHDNSNAGGVNVFVKSGGSWALEAYLTSTHGQAEDRFGSAVAISGETIAVGAPSESSLTTGINSVPNQLGVAVGAGYIFVRNGSNWSQEAYLKASNADDFDRFGESVDISDDRVVFGASFEDSSSSGINPNTNENLRDAGAAYIFTRSGGFWSQHALLKATYPGVIDYFGRSVAVSGDTVIAGSHGDSSNTTGVNSVPFGSAQESGAAYIYAASETGPLLDQDNDGLADFVESYFGTSPSVPNKSPISFSLTSDQLTLRWPEAAPAGIKVIPQWSPDLDIWLESDQSTSGITGRTITVNSPQPGKKEAHLNYSGLKRAYFRLNFSR